MKTENDERTREAVPSWWSAQGWALGVAFFYVASCLLLFPPIWALSDGQFSPSVANVMREILSIYRGWFTDVDSVLFFLGLFVAQTLFLFLPVRMARARPIGQRHLLIPVLLSSVCMGVLGMGGLLSIADLFGEANVGDGTSDVLWAGVCLLWIFWLAVFGRMGGCGAPGVLRGFCRMMLVGSIAELLVAVPSHIVARQRTDCCAGLPSLFGICMGISVMLFSFGPGVFFLYYERWLLKTRARRLSSSADSAVTPANSDDPTP